MIRKPVRLILCILFSIAILTACATPTPMPTVTPIPLTSRATLITPTPTLVPSATPIPPTPTPTQSALIVKPGSIKGKVDVGGRSLYITCLGEGSPTVIFESGWGLDSSNWGNALAEVSKHTLACAYDRAGLGRSDPATTFPRTSQDMVNDLHALLTKAPIPGPYFLVGHSLGGFNIRLYSSQYPKDVVGLVFVDGVFPELGERTCAALPTQSPSEDASITWQRAGCQATPVPVTDWSQVTEGFDWAASGDQVRTTGPFGDLPLVFLAAQNSITAKAGTADAVMGEIWKQGGQELAGMSSQGQYIVVPNTDHQSIPSTKAVSDAIIEMVDALQNK